MTKYVKNTLWQPYEIVFKSKNCFEGRGRQYWSKTWETWRNLSKPGDVWWPGELADL